MDTTNLDFLDLIRKHHHPKHPESDAQQYSAPEPPYQPQHRQQPQELPREPQPQPQPQPRVEQVSQKQQQDYNTPQPAAPDTRQKQINTTVPEDREPKNKMPTYKGLENFKLLEKMGEYVLYTVSSMRLILTFHPAVHFRMFTKQ